MVHDIQVCILLIDSSPGNYDGSEGEAGGTDSCHESNLSQLLSPASALYGEPAACAILSGKDGVKTLYVLV